MAVAKHMAWRQWRSMAKTWRKQRNRHDGGGIIGVSKKLKTTRNVCPYLFPTHARAASHPATAAHALRYTAHTTRVHWLHAFCRTWTPPCLPTLLHPAPPRCTRTPATHTLRTLPRTRLPATAHCRAHATPLRALRTHLPPLPLRAARTTMAPRARTAPLPLPHLRATPHTHYAALPHALLPSRLYLPPRTHHTAHTHTHGLRTRTRYTLPPHPHAHATHAHAHAHGCAHAHVCTHALHTARATISEQRRSRFITRA